MSERDEEVVVTMLTSHDTPPPIVVSDGSLIIESDDQFSESTSGGRFLFRGNGRPAIAHIRVLQDNGDKVYEDLNATGSRVEIVWINEDKDVTGNVIVSDGAVFEISSDKNLRRDGVPKRRGHK